MRTMAQDGDAHCVSPLNIPQGFMAGGLMNPERAHGCYLLCPWQWLARQLSGWPREGLRVGGSVCPGLLQCLSWLRGEVWLHKAKCFAIPASHFMPSLLEVTLL